MERSIDPAPSHGPLARFLWAGDLKGMHPLKRGPVKLMRIAVTLTLELFQGDLAMRAMSLVYTTLLSFVPLLAVSFSVLKGFGVHGQIEPLLLSFLEPLGEKGAELAGRIVEFVDNVKVGWLGGVGIALLLYTVLTLVHKVERAFNYIWRVAQPRRFHDRLSDYMSALVLGPVLVFSAMAITAAVTGSDVAQRLSGIQPIGALLDVAAKAVPYLLVTIAFSVVYVFLPNTRVRWRSALWGGFVAAVLWQSIGWAFAAFIVKSPNFDAIYSSFAILFLFMIWLYVAWLILLVGASVAFYHQQPEYLGYLKREMRLSNRVRERLALAAAYLVAKRHYAGEPVWTLEDLARHLNVPGSPLRFVLGALVDAGIVAQTGSTPPGYVPGRAVETITVRAVLDAARDHEDIGRHMRTRIHSEPEVDALLARVEDAAAAVLAERTLRDLVAGADTLSGETAAPPEPAGQHEHEVLPTERANPPPAADPAAPEADPETPGPDPAIRAWTPRSAE